VQPCSLLQDHEVTSKDLVKLGLTDEQARELLEIGTEEELLECSGV